MKHKTLSILLAMFMSMVACVASAHDFEVYGIYYNITSSTELNVSVTYRGDIFSSYSNEYTGSVVIPQTVTYSGKTYTVTSIGSSAFRGCSGLTSVTIGNSVTSIGGSTFKGCSSLTSVTIPNSVSSIGFEAFSGCGGLTSVTIPNSVTSIGYSAFSGCGGLTSVTIPNSVTSIGFEAFKGCSGLTSVTIPNSVTSIGESAFYGCRGLTSVTIPNSVTRIGKSAFRGCSGLTSVTIPNSVTSIGESAFSGCSGLQSIVIGNGVQTIGDYAFEGCNNFDDFYCFAPKSPTLGTDVFKDSYYKYATLHVPSTLLKEYRSTGAWSEFGNIVALTDEETGITTIDNGQQKAYIVYDMNGRKYTQMQRGVNIIRSADGTTRKVLVK